MSSLIEKSDRKKLDPKQRRTVILVLIASLILWKIVDFFSVIFFGFIIWFPSFFLSMVAFSIASIAEELVSPQAVEGISLMNEFTGPTFFFVIFASLQNALMTNWYLKKSKESSFVFNVYWLVAMFFILVVAVTSIFVLTTYGFGDLFDTFFSLF